MTELLAVQISLSNSTTTLQLPALDCQANPLLLWLMMSSIVQLILLVILAFAIIEIRGAVNRLTWDGGRNEPRIEALAFSREQERCQSSCHPAGTYYSASDQESDLPDEDSEEDKEESREDIGGNEEEEYDDEDQEDEEGEQGESSDNSFGQSEDVGSKGKDESGQDEASDSLEEEQSGSEHEQPPESEDDEEPESEHEEESESERDKQSESEHEEQSESDHDSDNEESSDSTDDVTHNQFLDCSDEPAAAVFRSDTGESEAPDIVASKLNNEKSVIEVMATGGRQSIAKPTSVKMLKPITLSSIEDRPMVTLLGKHLPKITTKQPEKEMESREKPILAVRTGGACTCRTCLRSRKDIPLHKPVNKPQQLPNTQDKRKAQYRPPISPTQQAKKVKLKKTFLVGDGYHRQATSTPSRQQTKSKPRPKGIEPSVPTPQWSSDEEEFTGSCET